MKNIICALFVYAFSIVFASPQLCETLIAEGRAALATNNFDVANARFRDAVTLCPTHQTGNVMYAATRLLTLAHQPAGSNFLSRLGVPVMGRDIIHWSADLARDNNGIPVAPIGVSAAEGALLIRTNLLPELVAAGANLAQVQNTNLLLNLSADETKMDAVTLDYGDVLVLRSMLRFMEYFSYTVHSLNFDLQLSALRQLYDSDLLSIERVLRDHPQLLTFHTIDDLAAAQAAFIGFVDRYVEASTFIRSRPPHAVRLFNLHLDDKGSEEDFRCTLLDLKASLHLPVILCTRSNYVVRLSRHFEGQAQPRSFLPEFAGNSFVAGTMPDVTFGGLIDGLSPTRLDRSLSRHLGVVTKMTGSNVVGQTFTGQFTTVTGHIYAVEYSSDMINWTELEEFFAEGGTYSFVDSAPPEDGLKFYRLVERSHYIDVSGRVLDACSLQPISGASVSLESLSDVTDAQGRFSFRSWPVDPPWQAFVEAEAPGYVSRTLSFWGDDSEPDMTFYLQPASGSPPLNDNFAARLQLTGTQSSSAGSNCRATLESGEPGGFFFSIANTVWWRWTAPLSGRVRVAVESETFTPVVIVYTGSSFATLDPIAEDYYEVAFDAVANTQYQIAVGRDEFDSLETGGFYLSLCMPPMATILSPEDGAEFSDPAHVLFEASASDANGSIREVRFYLNDDWIALFTNAPYRLTCSNLHARFYDFEIRARDNDGNITRQYSQFAVRPINDDFADRIVLVGTNIMTNGSSGGASSEPGEPAHAGEFGGFSVWWTWTAPANGPVTVTAFGRYSYGPNLLAIYTGSTVDDLTDVASHAFAMDGLGNQVTFQAISGRSYHIALDQLYPNNDPFTLKLVTTSPPTVLLNSPVDGATYQAPVNITFAATATDGDGSVVSVEFFDYDRRIGVDTLPPYQFVWTNAPSGSYFGIRARATDNRGVSAVSNPVNITVHPPAPSPLRGK
jgi:hypothetical protein